jgi:hypothetical protein
MKFFDKLRNKKKLEYHFEIHEDKYSILLQSKIDKGAMYKLFINGFKKLHKKSSLNLEDMPDSFIADEKQRKSLTNLVINKRFISDVEKDVKKDIPSFKIIDNCLNELKWESINLVQYNQTIVIEGVCYYEE